MKRFPSELEDTLIDFCHADATTLASCALVCRAWLPASRYHIFYAVSLTVQNVPRFLDIISSSTSIPHLVREVALCFTGPLLPDLVAILTLLKRTARLCIHPTRDDVTRITSTSALFPALTALQLVHLKFDFKSRFESLRQVVDCVCLCPRLESLEVGGSWLARGDFTVPPRLPEGLHTLTLTCDLDNFLKWLLTLEDEKPAIRNLILDHIVRREVPAIVEYLEALGPSLDSLSLAFRDHGAAYIFAGRVALARNPNLREFKLEGNPPGILESFSALLPQLHLCKAEHTTLSIKHGPYAGADLILQAYPWDVLDRILGDPQRCCLQRLTVAVFEPLTRAQTLNVMDYIVAQLPLAQTRGILA
ncbi:hypothetical protein DFH07DRAFT_292058 [Mycena maculata]|uniref:F-box domain-containing protein n=1 Tax=Mycena maculata TaxID=230809 RepID=A0AAD7NP68_9AGAR|nr:hypothetical protein DFH07DRAFT_292058 [Mycena maculata]